MAWVFIQIIHTGLLDNETGIHDNYTIGNPGHHSQIVRYPNDSHASLLANFSYQLDNLSLYGDIQGCGRFIGDQ